MKRLSFARHLPLKFRSPAEEILWYSKHIRLDDERVRRRELAALMGVGLATMDKWLAGARNRTDRVNPKRTRAGDPPKRALRLIRLELGVEVPYCQEGTEHDPIQFASQES